MSSTVIAVGTANRPEILNRCVAAAVEGCSVAREAHWIVLDDSSPPDGALNLEIVQDWRRSGLQLTYVDRIVEDEIVDSLPGSSFRSSFAHLVARSSSCRAPGGRNLALLTGLALNPEVLFFVDDDMVHRHEGNCFFHWCANSYSGGSFVAAPRKLGIRDMTYLNRLLIVLNRHDWSRFISDRGISAEPASWYSSENPLWKCCDSGGGQVSATVNEREVVSGQLMAIRDGGEEWLPFPSEYNEDVNWSFLQSSFHGTPLLRVSAVNARHLPPSLGHSGAEAIVSELVGTAITRALRQIKPSGEQPRKTLTGRFQDVLGLAIKQEVFLLLQIEGAIRHRVRTCAADGGAIEILSKIERTLVDVSERLKTVDARRLAIDWLEDIEGRRKMFLALRHNEMIQALIRGVLLKASA